MKKINFAELRAETKVYLIVITTNYSRKFTDLHMGNLSLLNKSVLDLMEKGVDFFMAMFLMLQLIMPNGLHQVVKQVMR
jgi:hypothetical protein